MPEDRAAEAATTEFAAYKALEFIASGPRGARAGKDVRDVVRPLINGEARISPIRALEMIGAISIYNRSRSQWMSITGRGYRLLTHWHENPPEKEHEMAGGLDTMYSIWTIFAAGFFLGLCTLPLLLAIGLVWLLRPDPEEMARRMPLGTGKRVPAPETQDDTEWV